MAKYLVLHTYKTSPQEAWSFLDANANQVAVAMASGQTPARCLKTWNPFSYGRADVMVCLWEADKPEQIEATLGGLLNHLTADIMVVDEVDWVELAKCVEAQREPA